MTWVTEAALNGILGLVGTAGSSVGGMLGPVWPDCARRGFEKYQYLSNTETSCIPTSAWLVELSTSLEKGHIRVQCRTAQGSPAASEGRRTSEDNKQGQGTRRLPDSVLTMSSGPSVLRAPPTSAPAGILGRRVADRFLAGVRCRIG